MKHFLRVFLVAGIVALVALATASSCGNVGGGNNGGGGSSGGGDNGGGGGNGGNGSGGLEVTLGKLKFAMADYTGLAKINADGDGIVIKASEFPATKAGDATDHFKTVVGAIADTTKTKKIFTVSLTGTTGGLLLVNGGDTAASNFSTSGKTDLAGTPDENKGIHLVFPNTGSLKIYSVFADKAAPTDDVFAFTPTTGPNGTQPIFYCVATASEPSSVTATLKGAQSADCYISSVGAAATTEAWVGTSSIANFKTSFDVTFAGIGTGDNVIPNIGHSTAATAVAKLAAFEDGIGTTEMKEILNANPGKSARRVMTLKIVNNMLFANTRSHSGGGEPGEIPSNPPKVKIVPVAGVAEVDGAHIKIKASAFPTDPAYVQEAGKEDDYTTVNLKSLNSVGTGTFKEAFSLVMTNEAGDDTKGGLLLVGPGNLRTGDFKVDSLQNTAGLYPNLAEQLEGIRSTKPTNANSPNEIYQSGWNIFSLFMSGEGPTKPTTVDNPDPTSPANAPFSFTAINLLGSPMNPLMFCRTTIETIVDDGNLGTTGETKLTGGQKVTCYVGVSTSYNSKDDVAFSGLYAHNWIARDGSKTFKRQFQIAVKGIATGEKGVKDIGLDETYDHNTTVIGAAADFREGLKKKDMADLAENNPNVYGKLLVSIENDDGLEAKVTTKPTPTDIKIGILDAERAKIGPKTNIGGQDIDQVLINADKFRSRQGIGLNYAMRDIVRADVYLTGSSAPVFEFEVVGGHDNSADGAVTGGLVLVDVGSKSKFEEIITTSADANVTYGSGPFAFLRTTATGTQGRVYWPLGLSFYGIFADKTAPTTRETVDNPNEGPFAFSFVESTKMQPVLVCRTTLSEIRNSASVNEDQKLTDYVYDTGQDDGKGGTRKHTFYGRKSWCYARARGADDGFDGNNIFMANSPGFTGANVDTWFGDTALDGVLPTKKSFVISVAGIRTDNKQLKDILAGFPQDTDRKRVEEFMNGLTPQEMALIRENNAYTVHKKILIRIVRQAEFDSP